MNKPNYKQIYAMKAKREKQIKVICPDIPYKSGIYVFYRIDEAGIRRAYCGQAVSLCERCASHLAEYDHIALSLTRNGYFAITVAISTFPQESSFRFQILLLNTRILLPILHFFAACTSSLL